MPKIQVKTYRKIYMTRKKGEYVYKSYFVYLPREMAEPLIGIELRITRKNSGILIEPCAN
ncbi:MAG TPA: hypothetical protein VFE98_03045 [Candidatus Bathyarchaeia archaeon]|nr:hypothetical protein [Candidatus Bathyarchaeia archaeon]